MATVDSAYHYYLSVYGNSASTRYDTHKKSELRSVYNSILKINKESPLYKIKSNENVPNFVIDIKENARQIKNVVASLSSHGDSLESAFQKKVAISSNDDIVSAEYVGNGQEDSASHFRIEVKQLASPQSNLGRFIKEKAKDVLPGEYSFDLNTNSASYEFQFTVNPEDNNRAVQDKIARLVNASGVGLSAEVISDEKYQSALKINSKQTGLSENESYLFEIHPDTSAGSIAAMDVLGIHKITTPAQNSSFILNDRTHTSLANVFTVNKTFELTLQGISEEDHAEHVGFKANVDAIADNLEGLINAYNGFIHLGELYSSNVQGRKLLSDLRGVTESYQNELESIGLLSKEGGELSIDRKLLADAVEGDDPRETFLTLNAFKNTVYKKADLASLDPMKYVDRVVVIYKNPQYNFYSPYCASLYSGMMLDYSC